jgi:hypothetical protein
MNPEGTGVPSAFMTRPVTTAPGSFRRTRTVDVSLAPGRPCRSYMPDTVSVVGMYGPSGRASERKTMRPESCALDAATLLAGIVKCVATAASVASTRRSKSTTPCRPNGLAASNVSGPMMLAEIA